MSTEETIRRLGAMTDSAAFERLATAILRQAKPEYAAIIHTGVNAEGKTIKSLVDGITFVSGVEPPHMIAVHHTICALNDLEKKWLHDPSSVKPRRGGKPTAPPGDVLKTAEIFASERQRRPSLRGTLILTTNREPDEELVRDANAVAAARGLSLDIWSATRLAHFLDNSADGQWLRRQHLDVEQERLSRDLLARLSRRSLDIHQPRDRNDAWITRTLDRKIADASNREILFIVAGSGLGKSVSCYRYLADHITSGGFGLVLPHQAVSDALTLDQAVEYALRQLHPSLISGAALDALQFCSPEHPLVLVIEDINVSGEGAGLAEKISGWARGTSHEGAPTQTWRLRCPVWPQLIASLNDQARKRVQALAIEAEGFSASEGREAVLLRARLRGEILSDLDADSISRALGHDPLLIALSDSNDAIEPQSVIAEYIRGCCDRLAALRGEYTSSDYQDALRRFAGAMLNERDLNPPWPSASKWLSKTPDVVAALRQMLHQCDVIRLATDGLTQRVVFRHDRVRDHLLGDALAEMMISGNLRDELISEPYFAEVLGKALLRSDVPVTEVERVRDMNPLALFFALQIFREPAQEVERAVLASISTWLRDPETRAAGKTHLRWAALAALSETEASSVLEITRKIEDRTWAADKARFRNGDVIAGLELCLHHEPGVRSPWRDSQIEHAKLRFGKNLVKAVDHILRELGIHPAKRNGALRLAGYLADSELRDAIAVCWKQDTDRSDHLDDYLWAAAQCCGEEPALLLAPICDVWASLSTEPKNEHSPSPRDRLAADRIRWAFREKVPATAIPYFIMRAQKEELRWPITVMLQGLDHPDAVEFVARQMAAMEQRIEGTDRFSPFTSMAVSEWTRYDGENRRKMSSDSRARLTSLWRDGKTDKHLREQSFRLWAATYGEGDIEVLRSIDPSDSLAEIALWQRVLRGDTTATPGLIAKLQGKHAATWWHIARRVWSEDVGRALNNELERRNATVSGNSDKLFESDYEISETIMELPEEYAESVLLKHWEGIKYQPLFVQAALYIATPRLLELVRGSIARSANPAAMFKHVHMHYGIKAADRKGVTRRNQIEALNPYWKYFDELDLWYFWELCNERRWFDLRRAHLDTRVSSMRGTEHLMEEGAIASLDQFMKRTYWIDHWVDEGLKTGISLDDIMRRLATWLARRNNIAAFQAVATAVIQRGRREDIKLLDVDVEPVAEASAMRADAAFAVRRRTLH